MLGPDPELPHPSYLELDRLFLLVRGAAAGPLADGELAAALPAVDAPLRAAAQHLRGCRQCQDYLTALQQRATAPLPAWVSAGPAEIRTKGGPSVAVFIKRGEKVMQWDGRTRLRPQDRIRLQVDGSGYAQVTVAHRQPGGAQVLYSGAVPAAAPTPLPVSWEVSAQGPSEVLAVILSPQPLAAATSSRLLDLAALRQKPELWVTELVMEKEEAR